MEVTVHMAPYFFSLSHTVTRPHKHTQTHTYSLFFVWFSLSLPPIILLHFVCQLWEAFHQFCVPEAKARLFLLNHSHTDGRHTVDLIGFCEFIMVITEHSGLQNLIPCCIVQRFNWCPFGQCERWCSGYERSWENRGDWGKCELEFVPGILVPSCHCVTVGHNIWQYLTFHLCPSSAHVHSATWATKPLCLPPSLHWLHCIH